LAGDELLDELDELEAPSEEPFDEPELPEALDELVEPEELSEPELDEPEPELALDEERESVL
jgi:hypothetical protein